MLYKVTLKAILRRIDETDRDTPVRAELMGSFEELGRDGQEIAERLLGQVLAWTEANLPEMKRGKDEGGGGGGGGGGQVIHPFPKRKQ